MSLRDAVNEYLEALDAEALFADGFDDAILGVGFQQSKGPFVVYDWLKCVEVLTEGGLSWDEAVEHMDFNVTGAWVGESTPVFLHRMV